jgi:hypothetical protein
MSHKKIPPKLRAWIITVYFGRFDLLRMKRFIPRWD